MHLVMQPGVGEVLRVHLGLGELRRRGRRGVVEGTHPPRRLAHPSVHEVRARRDARLVGVGRRRAAVERIGTRVTVGERRARDLAGKRNAWSGHADRVRPRRARGLQARVARGGGNRGEADGGRVERRHCGDAGVAAAGLVDETSAQGHVLEGGTAGVAVREGQAERHLGAAGEGASREREAVRRGCRVQAHAQRTTLRGGGGGGAIERQPVVLPLDEAELGRDRAEIGRSNAARRVIV